MHEDDLLNYYRQNPPMRRVQLDQWKTLLQKMIDDCFTRSEIYGWMKQHHRAIGLGMPAETTVRDWMTKLRKLEAPPADSLIPDLPNASTDSELTIHQPAIAQSKATEGQLRPKDSGALSTAEKVRRSGELRNAVQAIQPEEGEEEEAFVARYIKAQTALNCFDNETAESGHGFIMTWSKAAASQWKRRLQAGTSLV